MSLIALFELLAAIAALLAAILIFDQHLVRPRPYKIMWTIGLAAYGIAAASAFGGSLSHWTVLEYKLWYLFGGIMTAAFLGLGSLFLLGPRTVARICAAIAGAISVLAAIQMAMVTFSPDTIAKLHSYSTLQVTDVARFQILPVTFTIAAIVMNIPGTIFLFGGAVWSGWTFWKQHTPAYRVWSMALIALGALLSGLLSGLQRFGFSGGAALGEFLGAVCLLIGLAISLDVFTSFRVPFTRMVLYERRTVPHAPTAA